MGLLHLQWMINSRDELGFELLALVRVKLFGYGKPAKEPVNKLLCNRGGFPVRNSTCFHPLGEIVANNKDVVVSLGALWEWTS